MKIITLIIFSCCLLSCATSEVNVAYEEKIIKLNKLQGYRLNGNEEVTLRSGPGSKYKKVTTLEAGAFVGVAGPQSTNDADGLSWIPLKTLETKGILVGYATVDVAERLERTNHKFSPSN